MSQQIVKANVEGIFLELMQVGDRAARGVLDVMREEGEEIQKIAISYAPVDEHDLEQAIKFEVVDNGPFQRKEVRVFVDESQETSDGKTLVGEYASKMNMLLPNGGAGTLKLGDKSIAKDGGRGVVGGMFLVRAFHERQAAIIQKAQQYISRIKK